MLKTKAMVNYYYHKLVFVLLGLLMASAELPRFEHSAKADGSLDIFVVGDWGRKGDYNQSQVAHQMGIIGEKVDPDFIISTGDNFYSNGLIDVYDPTFEESFSNVYTAPSLEKQWYNVLGNHDYRGDALAQLSPILRLRDKRWFCMRSYIVDTEVAEFFFVDTTPFEDKYFIDPKEHTYDWRSVLPRDKYLTNQLEELDNALKESRAKWKIVVGHHTIRSAGYHGGTIELVHSLLPILEANNVDVYINGHDHCLQHITTSDSPLQFLTSGGGSKAWKCDINSCNPNGDDAKFYYDGQGFMALKISPDEIEINFFDIFGNVLHKSRASNDLQPVM